MKSAGGIDPESLLKGRYEAERIPEDFSPEHPLPGADTHPLSKRGLLDSPFLDTGDGRVSERVNWPDDKQFAVCLTHDIDHISANSPAHELRRGALRARMRAESRKKDRPTLTRSGLFEAGKGAAGGVLRASKAAMSTGEDPYHRWEDWLELESEVGARSTFFVLPEETKKEHVTDSVYRYDDTVSFEGEHTTLLEVLKEVSDRGWEVGLHGSWYSYDDVEEMRFQKEQIQDIVGDDVVSVRQHWLHHDIRKTPCVQQEAGLKYDSTLGPKGDVGFRFGTSYPWRLYDINKGTELDIIEVPLIVQDTALFDSKYSGMGPDDAFERVKNITKEVKQVGGVLTINWHNNADEERWNFYKRLLRYLDDQDPWFATVREVGEWWEENSGI
jgi:peptidoglycan/xylan/chitin deacetylase (PgdA/CDA1 family)